MPPKKKSPRKKLKPSRPVIHDPSWVVAKAPTGIIYNPPTIHRPEPPPLPIYARSHEILGGIILGAGHHNLANNLNLKPKPLGPDKDNIPIPIKALPPSKLHALKSSKYVGVTFRPTRVKYQSRIYKDNKEYNLGLYDVSADAALAYDITHRLMVEMLSVAEDAVKKSTTNGEEGDELEEKGDGIESPQGPTVAEGEIDSTNSSPLVQIQLHKLDELEEDPDAPSAALDWLDGESTMDTTPSSDKDSESLNFHKPKAFFAARKKEIAKRKLTPCLNPPDDSTDKKTPGQGTYPEIFHLKQMIRREAVRVAKAIIGGGAGIAVDDDGKKRKKKENDVNASDQDVKKRKENSKDIAVPRRIIQAAPNQVTGAANYAPMPGVNGSGTAANSNGVYAANVSTPAPSMQMQGMNTMNYTYGMAPHANGMMHYASQQQMAPVNQVPQAATYTQPMAPATQVPQATYAQSYPMQYQGMQYQGAMMPTMGMPGTGYNMMPNMYGQPTGVIMGMGSAYPANNMMAMGGANGMVAPYNMQSVEAVDNQMLLSAQQQQQLLVAGGHASVGGGQIGKKTNHAASTKVRGNKTVKKV